VSCFRFIAAEKANHPVSLLCRLLGVSRSGFHAWERRAPSDRELADAWLVERIREIHAESRQTYGARRVHRALRHRGVRVGRKRVERLMQRQQLSGLVPKRYRRTTIRVPGVRVADADRVRLGAHLAEGTTVMHEGFVNYNAGTLGASMVEGRVSAGVVVGDGSDVGGGASIMGTLSGGGKEVISVGRRCLIGANAGLGISLGDDCVVEAGLYLTAGTKVTLPDGTVTKARELSGQGNLLFLRNSVTGAVEARPRDGHGIVLNSALHAND